jgi:hypothetical protein
MVGGLATVGFEKSFEVRKGGGISRGRAVLADGLGFPGHGIGEGQQVAAVVDGQLHRLEQVEVAVHRSRAVVAGHGVFQASHRGVVMDVVRTDQMGDTGPRLVQEAGHGSLVEIEQERGSLAAADHLHDALQQFLGRVAVQAHVGLGFQDGGHLVDHLQQGPGEVVGTVPAVRLPCPTG